MINLSTLTYGVVCITASGESLILTDITSQLGWEEGEKELSERIANIEYNGVSPEVIRGRVQDCDIKETNNSSYLDITC